MSIQRGLSNRIKKKREQEILAKIKAVFEDVITSALPVSYQNVILDPTFCYSRENDKVWFIYRNSMQGLEHVLLVPGVCSLRYPEQYYRDIFGALAANLCADLPNAWEAYKERINREDAQERDNDKPRHSD